MPDIQERTLDGHKITRIGRGHYIVKSHSRPGTVYAVDLQSNDGLGHCECEDFMYRRLPHWKQVKAKYDHFRCKHLRAVRNHVMDQLISFYSDKPKDGHEPL